MKKRIIISIAILLLSGVFISAFQFLCPLIVTECDYTFDNVSDYELTRRGVDIDDSAENYLKLRVDFTVINMTVFEPRWSTIEIEAPADYADRLVGGQNGLEPEDANRFSKNTYTVWTIIDITGSSENEIATFIEGLTVSAKTVNNSEYASKSTLFEFVIADKLK